MADLIDRAALETDAWERLSDAVCDVLDAPAVDAVEVETLKAWLYGMAMYNTSNYLGDACEEIISRLDGLRVFARERRTDGKTD